METNPAFQIDENDRYNFTHWIMTAIYFFESKSNSIVGTDKHMKLKELTKFRENWDQFRKEHSKFLQLLFDRMCQKENVLITKEIDKMTNEIMLTIRMSYPIVTNSNRDQEMETEVEFCQNNLTPEGKQLLEDDLTRMDEDRYFDVVNDEKEATTDMENNSDDFNATDKNDFENQHVWESLDPMNCDTQTAQNHSVSNVTELSNMFFNMLESLKTPEEVDTLPEEQPEDHNFEAYKAEVNKIRNDVNKMNQETPNIMSSEYEWRALKDRVRLEQKGNEEDVEMLQINQDFIRKLEDQKREQEEKLKEAREKREQQKKELEQELEEIRHKQKQCFMVLLQCIQLRNSFDEKEAEVSDWIDNCYRKPIQYLLRGFADFEFSAQEWKQFKKVPEDSILDARTEVFNLHERVCVSLDSLRNSFDQLQELSQLVPDVLFLKVLQNDICNRAKILHNILEVLDNYQQSYEWYQKIVTAFSYTKVTDIPTTASLRCVCKHDFRPDYKDLEFPERIVNSTVIIDEVQEQEEIVHNINGNFDDLQEQRSSFAPIGQQTSFVNSIKKDDLKKIGRYVLRKRKSSSKGENKTSSTSPRNTFKRRSIKTTVDPETSRSKKFGKCYSRNCIIGASVIEEHI